MWMLLEASFVNDSAAESMVVNIVIRSVPKKPPLFCYPLFVSAGTLVG